MSDILVGIDDTDMPGMPGTNKLALHIVRSLAADFEGRLIVRHQLLEDPRVPCTSKNSCASIAMRRKADASIVELADRIREMFLSWCPEGSDPGLCLAERVPGEVQSFGRRCQCELVSQGEARKLAAGHGIYLEGLGGTEGGVIGALAAVGLMATADDGRVIHFGDLCDDPFQVGGPLSIATLQSKGVAEVRCVTTGAVIEDGVVDVGKRLRPNLRGDRVVLFVEPAAGPSTAASVDWRAVRFP